MRASHFSLYSSIRQALDEDLRHVHGKDLIALVRSVDVLRVRFEGQTDTGPQLNGSGLIGKLLQDQRLVDLMEVLNSSEGRQLINIYKSSLNDNEQNMACSRWRVQDIEQAAQSLNQSSRLASVFSGVHRLFVERSARKCLKSACKSLNENMNSLDSVMRRRNRHRAGGSGRRSGAGVAAEFTAGTNELEETTVAGPEVEPGLEPLSSFDSGPNRAEFHDEELELCRFLKRTNSSSCQASGRELGSIKFAREPTVDGPELLADYLADYERTLSESASSSTGNARNASQQVLAQCRAIGPLLDYHLFGLRWYTQNNLIRSDKLESRAVWCPSLNYWLELDRLCKELELRLGAGPMPPAPPSLTFAY